MPGMGKSLGFPVASDPPWIAAVAEIRQSACHNEIPRSAKARRHSPACHAPARSIGRTTSPANNRVAASVSAGLSPRTISSALMAVVAGTSPVCRSALTRSPLAVYPGSGISVPLMTVIGNRGGGPVELRPPGCLPNRNLNGRPHEGAPPASARELVDLGHQVIVQLNV